MGVVLRGRGILRLDSAKVGESSKRPARLFVQPQPAFKVVRPRLGHGGKVPTQTLDSRGHRANVHSVTGPSPFAVAPDKSRVVPVEKKGRERGYHHKSDNIKQRHIQFVSRW